MRLPLALALLSTAACGELGADCGPTPLDEACPGDDFCTLEGALAADYDGLPNTHVCELCDCGDLQRLSCDYAWYYGRVAWYADGEAVGMDSWSDYLGECPIDSDVSLVGERSSCEVDTGSCAGPLPAVRGLGSECGDTRFVVSGTLTAPAGSITLLLADGVTPSSPAEVHTLRPEATSIGLALALALDDAFIDGEATAVACRDGEVPSLLVLVDDPTGAVSDCGYIGPDGAGLVAAVESGAAPSDVTLDDVDQVTSAACRAIPYGF